jgi:Transcriptional regulator, AbiEi antitoxin
MDGKRRTRLLDLAVVALAGRQHGVVSWAQLADLGMSSDELYNRVAAGRLHRLHRGVYAVVEQKLLRTEGRWLAAVQALGDGAALSHRSAAALWDLLPATGRSPDVSLARRARPRAGIQVHCVRSLSDEDVTIRNAIPCTAVARTIVDVAAVVALRRLERVLGQAEVLRLYDRRAIERVLAANPGRPGSRTLRTLLDRRDLSTSSSTRSKLEERFLALCDSATFPRPELNAPFTLPDGTEIQIDALWRSAGLAIELDSRGFHSSWAAQVHDRRRAAQLTLAGLKPLRFTDSDLVSEKRTTVALLRELLGTPRASGPSESRRPTRAAAPHARR